MTRAVTCLAYVELMPAYHFTLHAYGTWLPNKPKGYVHRKQGIQPRDDALARCYRANQKQTTIHFTLDQQHEIAATLRVAGKHLDAIIHCIAIEPTHIHVVISWRHVRDAVSMRSSIKSAISRMLNERFGRRTWLCKGASRKQIKDHDHFCFLIRRYLPCHRGLFWLREADRVRFGVERKRDRTGNA